MPRRGPATPRSTRPRPRLRASSWDCHPREADRRGRTRRAGEALVPVRGAAALDAEVSARARLQRRPVVDERLAAESLELHVPRALSRPHVAPDRHAAAALLYDEREPVGGQRGLVLAVREAQ